jgi:hypothetical protein
MEVESNRYISDATGGSNANGAATESAITRDALQGEGLRTHEGELLVKENDVGLQTFEVVSLFIMR